MTTGGKRGYASDCQKLPIQQAETKQCPENNKTKDLWSITKRFLYPKKKIKYAKFNCVPVLDYPLDI